ncbi:exporter of polyketide antibiotics [Brevibacterium daeguense]|uniref:Exporter of polyketide antibiotics n=1 Tax=Brevibacterium daeguense TaxID=909936 RepID=A0ABP8EHH2_9MICO|nr:polyketide antibiotic transporter [Brevibacterium daeguense]
MTTLTRPATSRIAPAHEAPRPERFAGTGMLLRLFLRLDRLRIAIWAAAFFLLVWASVLSLDATYSSPESLQARAALLNNPAAIMMTGPAFALDNYTFGAMIANELALWVFLPAAIMSVLLVVRHTRKDEEEGRLELLRTLPIGRFAPPTAAVITVALANLAVGLAVSAGLLVGGMEADSSLAMGAATALTGLVFGAVAAVAAQISEHSSTVTGMSLGVLAVAFIVRGFGDVIDNQGSWLSWLSPFAWGQQTRLFVDLRWWPLAVSAGAALVLLVIAMLLAHRRDLGAGLRAPRPGPASASARLLSPAGLAHRLVSGMFLGWAIGLFLFAVAFGTLASELEDMLVATPEVGEWIPIDLDNVTRSFAAVILSLFAIGPAALMVAGVLRLRGEEQAGRLDGVLVSGSSRTGVLAGWLAVVVIETALVLVLLGLGVGLGLAVATEDAGWIGELTLAALVYLPAVYLIGALAVGLYGLAPRVAGLAWLLVIWVSIAVYLGGLLDLPEWAMNTSPLTHTPLVPDADPEAPPLLIMSGLAVVVVVVGFLGLRRRDIGNR